MEGREGKEGGNEGGKGGENFFRGDCTTDLQLCRSSPQPMNHDFSRIIY